MVSQRFVAQLVSNVSKQLKKVISRPPEIQTYGSSEDQQVSKGLLESLGRSIVGGSTSYSAQEYVLMRVHVNDPHLEYFDFITPTINVRGKSVQGIATFSAVTPYPVPETFVLRGIIFTPSLYPYELVVNQKIAEKKILKGGMIRSAAINAVNADKKLRKKLRGSDNCQVQEGSFSKKYFKLNFDVVNYDPGMFTVFPYHGYSVMIAKEAGGFSAEMDKPRYDFKSRYESFSGIAYHIANNPEHGAKAEGVMVPDLSINLSLGPLLKAIKDETGQGEAGEEYDEEY